MSEIKEKDMMKLFNRVYKNEMTVDPETEVHDEEAIKAVCAKVFGDGGRTPDPTALHQFNNLVVEMADEIAKPKVTELIGILANTSTEMRGSVKQLKLPTKAKAKVIWSANGSGVDLVRIAGQKSVMAAPKTFTTGFYYEPLDLVTDSVTNFRALINDLAEAKVRLYMKNIAELTVAAVSSAKIPANNVVSGSNTSITDYNKLVSRMARYGGVPVLVADVAMINDLAMKQPADATLGKLISDDLKDVLLSSLNITQIGRSKAINLVNPFTDAANSKVDLDPQKGYMFTGEGAQKPFAVVEYGGMRQMTEQNIEDERIKLKIAQDASIVLLYGEILGYLVDNSITV